MTKRNPKRAPTGRGSKATLKFLGRTPRRKKKSRKKK